MLAAPNSRPERPLHVDIRSRPEVAGSEASALRETRLWVERVVIGLSLCPWARAPSEEDAIRYAYIDAPCPGEDARILAELRREIELLRSCAELETTVLIAPSAYREDFLGFCALVQDAEEALLHEEGLEDDFQIVGFHPQHQFAGYRYNDPGNFANRSPHPMFHILKQESVTRAVESHTDTLDVPRANQQRLRSIGVHLCFFLTPS